MKQVTGLTLKTFDKAELVLLLQQQLLLIEDFTMLFDKGKEYVASDIAVKLRVIFHSTNNSTSLMRHLKLEHIMMLDTASQYNSKNLLAHHGLTGMRIPRLGERGKFTPIDRPEYECQFVSLHNWWSTKKVIVDPNKKSYYRKDLVSLMANKEGGAHVPEFIEDEHYQLTRGKASGWVFRSNEEEYNLNPVPAAIRQIASEVLRTFKQLEIAKESKLR